MVGLCGARVRVKRTNLRRFGLKVLVGRRNEANFQLGIADFGLRIRGGTERKKCDSGGWLLPGVGAEIRTNAKFE